MIDGGVADEEDARATPTLSGNRRKERESTPLGKDVPLSVVTGIVPPGPGLPDSTSSGEREKLTPGRARAKSISPMPTAERVDILAVRLACPLVLTRIGLMTLRYSFSLLNRLVDSKIPECICKNSSNTSHFSSGIVLTQLIIQ